MVDTVINNTQMIKEIELNITRAKELVATGNALERLCNNKDFKSVITDGYLSKEAVRLVHLKSDVSMQTPERQQSILKQIDAIGMFTQYFDTVRHSAALAAKAITTDEETLEEILTEDMSNV